MPKRKANPAPRYADQPAVAAILKMLQSRRGATVAEIAKARGLQPHTVRSQRLGARGSRYGQRTNRPALMCSMDAGRLSNAVCT